MSDVPPQHQDLDILAASLRADASDIGVFFQVLGGKLLDAMPGAVQVHREGGLFKKDHPITKITVTAEDDIFDAELKGGSITCRHSHAVRGITLRSEQTGLDAWLRTLVGVLAERAQTSAEASAALRSLVT